MCFWKTKEWWWKTHLKPVFCREGLSYCCFAFTTSSKPYHLLFVPHQPGCRHFSLLEGEQESPCSPQGIFLQWISLRPVQRKWKESKLESPTSRGQNNQIKMEIASSKMKIWSKGVQMGMNVRLPFYLACLGVTLSMRVLLLCNL